MIVRTTDWRRLVSECQAIDLDCWSQEWRDIDWSATLAQDDWHLITDEAGSWCLLQPVKGSATHLEAHLIIAADRRGRAGLSVAQAMLDWIAGNLPIVAIYASTTHRKATLFLRWLGFELCEGQRHRLKFIMNVG